MGTNMPRQGWGRRTKPLVMVFWGPSGTGKTELARQLASIIHHEPAEALLAKKKFVRFSVYLLFTGTNVQILTPEERRCVPASQWRNTKTKLVGHSVYLLYWYKSTNPDTPAAASASQWRNIKTK